MSRRSPPLSSLNADERRRMIDEARYKVGEAEFFLGKMKSLDRSPNLETRGAFQYYLSAFLSAARSSLQILCPTIADWTWVNTEISIWPQDRRDLYEFFRGLRNKSIHVERTEADTVIEMVTEGELRRDPPGPLDGRVIVARFPGSQPVRFGVARYRLRINGADRCALECCIEYRNLVSALVSLREATDPW